MSAGRLFLDTIAGGEALSLIEAPPGGAAASGVLVDGATGRVALMCRGKGVVLGPLEAADLDALAAAVAAAAAERRAAEAVVASAAAAAVKRIFN
jgi:hypothetical protein